MNKEISQALLRVKAHFPNTYVGGSYAVNILLGGMSPNDIDLFVLEERRPTWAVVQTLETIFDTVDSKDKPEEYGEGVFKRYQCTLEMQDFDLIFMDCDIEELVGRYSGTTLGSIYYNIKFGIIKQYDESILSLNVFSNKYSNMLFVDNRCDIHISKCTSKHREKTVKRCKELELTLTQYS